MLGQVHAITTGGRGVHLKTGLSKYGIEETTYIVIIFNYYGNTKITHSCPSIRQCLHIAQR
ncbi:hypothetical protein NKCBBBOE_02985 [Pseudarthrobacter sp. MM222]|nr:hypothetical protein NKCBBBOE_02985 [Pseudarthrobacter sp. MM222]